MKLLAFNGSPRAGGDTAWMLQRLAARLPPGEVCVLDAYHSHVGPCVDCRYCWAHPGCAVKDGMQEIYASIEAADVVVIASPVYFSELTGPLLSLLSRLQTYYSARTFRNETPILKEKAGGILLTGGGDGSMKKALETASVLLRQMNVKTLFPAVTYHNSNVLPAREAPGLPEKIMDLAARCNTWRPA